MRNFNNHFLATLGLGLLAATTAHAQQGIGTGATAPRTMLDVNGAISVTETTAAVSGNAATVPTGYSLVRLTGTATAPVTLTAASSPAPVAGQQLTIYNPTGYTASFAGQPILTGQSLAFVYSGGNWQATAGGGNGITASNGLTKTGSNITLGGTLQNNTLIANGGFNFALTGTGKFGIGTATPTNDITIQQSAAGKGIALTGASIGGATDNNGGATFLLGYNATGNRQLWQGDLAGVGLARGTFTRTVVQGDPTATGSTAANQIAIIDAVSGDGTLRRPLTLGAIDSNGGLQFGGASATPAASFVWDASNMTIGGDYQANAAPTNGLLVQGNVGIGTGATAPVATLDVAGTARIATLATGASADNLITVGTTGILNQRTAASVLAGATTNTLSNTNGTLTSTVNGMAASAPVLISANNGLTATNGNVQLGGTLTQPTVIANAGNNLNITGAGGVGIGSATAGEKLEVGGNIRLGSEPATATTGWGNYLEFDGNGVNSDIIGLGRYNTSITAGGASELRLVLGDDGAVGPGAAAADRFLLGYTTASSGPGQVASGTFTPTFYVYSNGATGIGLVPASTNLLDVAGTAGTSNVRMASLGGTGTRLVQSLADGTLTSATAASVLAGATTNTLSNTNGTLTSTVNGIAASAPVLISANNGLTATNGNVQLGGTLLQGTTVDLNTNNLNFTSTTGTLSLTSNNAGISRTVLANANTSANSRADLAIGANNKFIYLGEDESNTIFSTGVTGSKAYLDNRTGGRLGIGSNGVEQLSLLTNGNLGIGVTAPTQALDVNGTVRLRNAPTGAYSDNIVTIDPATGVVYSQPGRAYINNITGYWSYNSATNSIYNNNGANVGIGTSTPKTDLNIQQTAGGKGISLTGNAVDISSDASGATFVLGHNSSGNRQLWSGDQAAVGKARGTFTRTVVLGDPASTTTNQAVTIDAVAGDGNTRRPISFGASGDANSGVMFGGNYDNGSTSYSISTPPVSFVWDNGNMAIGTGYHDYAAPANGLLVQGNVGIGTGSAGLGNNLQVQGAAGLGVYSGSSTAYAQITFGRTGVEGIIGTAAAADQIYTGTVAGDNALRASSGSLFVGTYAANPIIMVTNNAERMRIGANGNLGIGTTTLTYALNVGGDINATGSVRSNGTALTSDARLKRNVTPLTNGLATVQQLHPVAYDKKSTIASTDYNRHELGFIAQEVRKVLPTLVSEGKDADKTLALSYVELIPVLTKAIQEQQAEIESLKTVNAKLATDEKASASTVSEMQAALRELRAEVQILKAAGTTASTK